MDTLIKPSLLALTIASALSANANAEIILSQYVEGGSYNKAVEIANTGDAAVTLTGYELAKSSTRAVFAPASPRRQKSGGYRFPGAGFFAHPADAAD